MFIKTLFQLPTKFDELKSRDYHCKLDGQVYTTSMVRTSTGLRSRESRECCASYALTIIVCYNPLSVQSYDDLILHHVTEMIFFNASLVLVAMKNGNDQQPDIVPFSNAKQFAAQHGIVTALQCDTSSFEQVSHVLQVVTRVSILQYERFASTKSKCVLQ